MFKTISETIQKHFQDQRKKKAFQSTHEETLEKSLVGQIILNPNIQDKVKSNQINASTFIDPINQKIMFGIQKYLITDKRTGVIDIHILTNDIFCLYPDDFLNYQDVQDRILVAISYSAITNFDESVKSNLEIKNNQDLQKIKDINFLSKSNEEIINEIEIIISETKQKNNKTVTPFFGEVGFDFYMAEKNKQANEPKITLPFITFANHGVELGSTHLVVVAGRPKSGKSKFSMQLAIETAKTRPVLFFTLEMSQLEIIDQAIAYLGKFNPMISQNMQSGDEKYQRAIENHKNSYVTATNELFGTIGDNFKIVGDKRLSIWEIAEIIKQENTIKKLDMVVIDQLSFVSTGNRFNKKIEQYDFIVREFKELAKELKICIVLNCQLNRGAESREEEGVALSDIKDSSAIEETADMLFLMNKSTKSKNSTETSVPVIFSLTSRHNMSGLYELQFNKKLARFEDLNLITK